MKREGWPVIRLGILLVSVAASGPVVAHPWHRHRTADFRSESDGAAAAEPDGRPDDRRIILTAAPGGREENVTDLAAAFAPFEKLEAISTRHDGTWFYVESRGIPDHPLMVGIRAWQQQVPLPQAYTGDNAWRIPIHPVRASEPARTKNRFLRGAIAVAVNGIPIFNPLNNRGEDALAIGELDEYGGHCGRADDYHYHVAPTHLEKVVGKGRPIAYALDGYPIFGFTEPDGAPLKPLDILGGHDDGQGGYHYHAMRHYPYLIGGFRGEVVEKDGQVDPQPRARGVREALPPLRGARIIAFESPAADTRKLVYEIAGRTGSVQYTVTGKGGVTFTFTDVSGRSTTASYAAENRDSGGGVRPRGRERDDRGAADPPPRGAGGETAPAAAAPQRRARRITVRSPAIGADGRLPVECTCDGAGVSPPLEWDAGPAGTHSYALVLWHEAPDRLKSYWVVHGIPASTTRLAKGSRTVGTTGLNDKGRPEYDPMCSKGPGIKTYHLTVYAVSAAPRLPAAGVNRETLLAAIRDTTLAEGTLTFTSEREPKR